MQHLQFVQKQGIYYTFRIAEDAGDDCSSQSTSDFGRRIRSECLTGKAQSLDLVTKRIYSQTLLTLLDEIPPKLVFEARAKASLPALSAAMIGHIALYCL